MRATTARAAGFTLIELLVVLAVVGILAAVGFTNLRRDHFAVSQTAEGLARDYQLARFEAIRRNEHVGLQLDVAAQEYVLFQDDYVGNVRNGQADAAEVFKRVAVADLGGVAITGLGSGGSAVVLFDPRGVARTAAAEVHLGNRGGDFARVVCVSRQGRPRVEAGSTCEG